VQVRDDEKALVLVLISDAIVKAADIVSQVKLSGWTVSRQHSLCRHAVLKLLSV